MLNTQIFIDKTAISLSVLCASHCLMLPLMLSLFPAFSSTFVGDETFHKMMALFVLPSSLIALSMGCSKHKNILVLGLGFVGLTLLLLPIFLSHEVLGEGKEKIITVLGAALIGLSHLGNYRLCRGVNCRQ